MTINEHSTYPTFKAHHWKHYLTCELLQANLEDLV